MNLAWTMIFVIHFGQKGCAHVSSGGCCNMESSQIVYNTTFLNNSAHVCKRYCFEGENRTIYAATSLYNCYCIDKFNGSCVTKGGCIFQCPGHRHEFCGGVERITVYDSKGTTTQSTTTTTHSTTDNTLVSTKVSSTSNLYTTTQSATTTTHSTTDNILVSTKVSSVSNSDDGSSFWQYSIIIAVTVVVVTIQVLILMLKRRLRMRRKRRKVRKPSESPASVLHHSDVELSENATVASRQDNVDTEYDTTTTSRPNPLSASSVEDDYSGLRILSCADATYSHVRNNQHGACALLEADYSHLGRHATKTEWTSNKQNNIDAKVYDNVQFKQSCIEQSVKNDLKFGTCDDEVYHKLQNRL